MAQHLDGSVPVLFCGTFAIAEQDIKHLCILFHNIFCCCFIIIWSGIALSGIYIYVYISYYIHTDKRKGGGRNERGIVLYDRYYGGK